MLSHLKEIVYEAFFRIGYKLGSLIGYIGGSSLGSGFEKGLAKRVQESIERYASENNYEQMIRDSLDKIIIDFLADVEYNPGAEDALNSVRHTSVDFAENEIRTEHVDQEVQEIIHEMEANQP